MVSLEVLMTHRPTNGKNGPTNNKAYPTYKKYMKTSINFTSTYTPVSSTMYFLLRTRRISSVGRVGKLIRLTGKRELVVDSFFPHWSMEPSTHRWA